MKPHGPKVPLLLVEDDPEDIKITQRAFSRGKIMNPLYVVRNGEEALAFLKHDEPYADPDQAPRPGLILLDLNMPRVDGREVLKEVKSDPELRCIPVVVLTSSEEEADVLGCYNKGANTYIVKPVEFDKLLDALLAIGEYWFYIAELPDRSPKSAE